MQRREQVRAALLDRLRTELAHRLADCPAAEVRLFGSWARADFDGRSDVDLALIAPPERLPAAEAALADLAVALDRDVDVLAVTPAASRSSSRCCTRSIATASSSTIPAERRARRPEG